MFIRFPFVDRKIPLSLQDSSSFDDEPGEETRPGLFDRFDPRALVGVALGAMAIIFVLGFISFYFFSQQQFGGPPAGPMLPPGEATLTPSATAIPALTETPAPPAAPPSPTFDVALTNLAATAMQTPHARFATLTEIIGVIRIKMATTDWAQVTQPLTLLPGATVLTDENSSVKITLSEGSIIRLSSQTQFTLVELSGEGDTAFSLLQLDFGKLWAIVASPLRGQFRVRLPVGVAAVRGSFMSAEHNTTDQVEIVTCLEGRCRYENTNGGVDLLTGQQTESINGGSPSAPHRMDRNQLDDWNKQEIPEVATLTPTRTPSYTPSQTFTPSLTRTATATVPTSTPSPTVPTNTPIPTWTPSLTWTPVPTLTPTFTITLTPTPGPPTKLVFIIQPPSSIGAGAVFAVKVAIQDASGVTVPYASDNVTLSLGANPGNGALAGTTTVGAVNGLADFPNNLSVDKAGVGYTLKASAAGLTDGFSAAFTVNAGPATSLSFTAAPSSVAAGSFFNVTITAKDAYGNIAPSYTGTVRFTSNDTQASLPVDYTFTSGPTGDNGSHTFKNLILKTAGGRTLTAADTTDPSITGTSPTITVNSGPATTLSLSGIPNPSYVDTPVSFVVKAFDAYGNLATGFNGSVTFAVIGSSGDFRSPLGPDPYIFNGTEGAHNFSIKFLTTSNPTAEVRVVCQGQCTIPDGAQSGITVLP